MCIFLWANSFFYSNIKLLKITENHITLSIESICVSVFQSPSLSIKIWRHLWQNILFCVSHKMSMYEMNVVHMCANCISFDSMKTFNIILTLVFFVSPQIQWIFVLSVSIFIDKNIRIYDSFEFQDGKYYGKLLMAREYRPISTFLSMKILEYPTNSSIR